MYPTRVRSFALGLNNSMSRIGAIVSPFVSVNMIKSGHLRGAEGLIAGFCIAATFCICFLPKEKASRSLEVCVPCLSSMPVKEEASDAVGAAYLDDLCSILGKCLSCFGR